MTANPSIQLALGSKPFRFKLDSSELIRWYMWVEGKFPVLRFALYRHLQMWVPRRLRG